MEKFIYKAKNCTDISDTTYAKKELLKMIEHRRENGKPVKKLCIMLWAVAKKHEKFKQSNR